jgi:hypothetical protein
VDDHDLPKIDELTASDRLFAAGDKDWMSNACLNFGDPEIGYVDGFRKAADLAVEHVLVTGHDQDYLVYPVVFGYRQYLELRLKGLLRDASRLLDRASPSPKLLGQHKLSPLWNELHPLLEAIFADDNSEQRGLIGERIEEFSEMDPDSFSFRYATTKAGTQSLPRDLWHINLGRLRMIMEKMAAILDGADNGISVHLEHKAEMREYYAGE